LAHGLTPTPDKSATAGDLLRRATLPPGWEWLDHLGYITPVANLTSILRLGILSHNRARALPHHTYSDQQIQQRRDSRKVDGRSLHDFTNLFINPRNAMLYRVIDERRVDDVAVVLVDAPAVFALPGVVVTERNAAAQQRLVTHRGSAGLANLDPAAVTEESWFVDGEADPDLKQLMMAEVLVPDLVPPQLISEVVVAHPNIAHRVRTGVGPVPVTSNPYLFFRSASGDC